MVEEIQPRGMLLLLTTYHDTHGSPHYLKWLKSNLAAGHGVVWFIMCKGDGHNCYDIPNATYDHIERECSPSPPLGPLDVASLTSRTDPS